MPAADLCQQEATIKALFTKQFCPNCGNGVHSWRFSGINDGLFRSVVHINCTRCLKQTVLRIYEAESRNNWT